jgi:hypothetical protein
VFSPHFYSLFRSRRVHCGDTPAAYADGPSPAGFAIISNYFANLDDLQKTVLQLESIWFSKKKTRYIMSMKNLVFVMAFTFGAVFSGLAQTTNIIVWQTNWPAGGTNNIFTNQLNLPVSSPWYTGTKASVVGVSNGVTTNLVASDVSGSSSLTWWTYFAPVGISNNSSAFSMTNTTSMPVQLSPGKTIQLAVQFTVRGSGAQNSNRHLRFGLLYSGTNANATGGSNAKNTSVSGYGQNMNFGTTFGVAPLQTFADTNNPNDTGAILSSTSEMDTTWSPNSGGTTNDPGFIDGTNYTLMISVKENNPTNMSITTTFWGSTFANGSNITQTVTDTNYCYTNYDTFVMRLNDGATTATNWSFSSFKVVTITSPAGSPIITNSLSGGYLTLSWSSDYLGWNLESQTNTLSTGLSNNWVVVANSSTTNKVVLPVTTSTTGAVFFRLISP